MTVLVEIIQLRGLECPLFRRKTIPGEFLFYGIQWNFTEFRYLIPAELRNSVKSRRNSVVRNSAGHSGAMTSFRQSTSDWGTLIT